ncbi:MAG: hypothetical protein IIX66_03825, partial [Alistipes sp.]|nr:hypothetical protein [Alistipes sp.]
MDQTKQMLPIVAEDEWLQPVEAEMNARYACYKEKIDEIEGHNGSISNYANGYHYYGWQWDDV